MCTAAERESVGGAVIREVERNFSEWCRYGAAGGFNSYWEMPFRSQARITLENTHDEPVIVYFQIDYWLGAVAEESAYLHTQWQRSNPLPAKTVHTLLDGVEGSRPLRRHLPGLGRQQHRLHSRTTSPRPPSSTPPEPAPTVPKPQPTT